MSYLARLRSPRWQPLAIAGVALSALVGALPDVQAASPSPSYAVTTESPGATREASRLLEAGGNAIDAAVLAALVAGFTNPSSSGIGGGGFALIWSARDRKPYIFDFRETAPAGIDPASLDKRPLPPEKRGVAVGVPGEVAGLFELHQRFGQLKWRDVVLRAARLAERGFVTEPHTAWQLGEQKQSPLTSSPTFRSVYLPGGAPAPLGKQLRATKLGKTLTRIANEGKRGFYEGAVARDVVKAAQAAGSTLALTDLTNYRVVERVPLSATWAGKQVFTMPPPSAGGVLLLQTLGLFSPGELTAMNAEPGKRLHLLAEGMRGAFADRARYLGDPAFEAMDLPKLMSPARLARRKALMAADRTHTQPRFGLEEAGTHHLATADQHGNWVSLTTTVNEGFGAKIMAEQSGVILNNELTDFSTPDSVAVFGMKESPNRVRAGARPVSSMTPTLVIENGEAILSLGGSGAITIAPNATQVLLNHLVYGMPIDAAVAAPRFMIPPPRTGQTLWLEAALSKPYAADLEARGELLQTRDWKNAVQAIARTSGTFTAAADPRKSGTAAVVNSPAAAPSAPLAGPRSASSAAIPPLAAPPGASSAAPPSASPAAQ